MHFKEMIFFKKILKKHVIKEADSAKHLEIYLQFPRLWLEVIAIIGLSIFLYILDNKVIILMKLYHQLVFLRSLVSN